eukprot:1159106-Pelagomonas_calceolata.AAC.2
MLVGSEVKKHAQVCCLPWSYPAQDDHLLISVSFLCWIDSKARPPHALPPFQAKDAKQEVGWPKLIEPINGMDLMIACEGE